MTSVVLRPALRPWLAARALVALGFLAALVAADVLLDGQPVPLRQRLLAWDGSWYADIAVHGYGALPREALRFFPLFPLLGRVLAVPLLGHTGAALVLVANAAALAAGVLLHRLVVEETGDAALAGRSVWLFSLFPAAAVLAFAYAEALSVALAAGTFLALRRRRFGAAAVTGYLAGLTRPVGAVLALPAAIEAGRAASGSWLRRGAAVLAPVAGLATYLAWVGARFDDAWLPLRAHEAADLRGDWVFPLERVVRSFGALLVGDRFGDGLHVPFILGAAALLVVVFRRWPASYGWYALVLVLVALSAESLGSFERYCLAAFPLFLGFAQVTARPTRERPALTPTPTPTLAPTPTLSLSLSLALSAAALVSFTALVLLAVFVP